MRFRQEISTLSAIRSHYLFGLAPGLTAIMNIKDVYPAFVFKKLAQIQPFEFFSFLSLSHINCH